MEKHPKESPFPSLSLHLPHFCLGNKAAPTNNDSPWIWDDKGQLPWVQRTKSTPNISRVAWLRSTRTRRGPICLSKSCPVKEPVSAANIMLKHPPKTQEIVICQSHGNNGAGKKMVSKHNLETFVRSLTDMGLSLIHDGWLGFDNSFFLRGNKRWCLVWPDPRCIPSYPHKLIVDLCLGISYLLNT